MSGLFTFKKTLKTGSEVYLVLNSSGTKIGEIIPEVDGYFVFWPSTARYGFLSQEFFLEIGEKLKELNAPWNKQVKNMNSKGE